MQLRKEIGSIMVYSVQKENLGGRREGEAMRGSVSGCAEEVEPLSPAQPGGGRGPDTTEPPAAGVAPAAVEGRGLQGLSPCTASSGQGRKPRAPTAMAWPLTVLLWAGVRASVCSFIHSFTQVTASSSVCITGHMLGVKGTRSACKSR